MVEVRSLSGRRGNAVSRTRLLLVVLILAVTGVLVGLLAMHVLGGTPHAAHDAAHTAASQSMSDDHAAPGVHCGETGCDELWVMAASCVLALLALTLLLPASPVRWFVRTSAPPTRSTFPLLARFAPTPSLVALSISRT